MLYSCIDELLKKMDSRLSLVTLVTKRAHQLNNKAPVLISNPPASQKPVVIALAEVVAGKIKAKRFKEKAA